MSRKPDEEQKAHLPSRRVLTEAQQAAWERTQRRMREGLSLDVGKLDRDALHDRDAMRREFLRDAK